MTKYREILRLLSNQLKTDEIVHACNVSKKKERGCHQRDDGYACEKAQKER